MTRKGVYFPRSRCPSCGSLAPLTIGKGGTYQPLTDWVEIQCAACAAKAASQFHTRNKRRYLVAA